MQITVRSQLNEHYGTVTVTVTVTDEILKRVIVGFNSHNSTLGTKEITQTFGADLISRRYFLEWRKQARNELVRYVSHMRDTLKDLEDFSELINYSEEL